MVGIGTLRYSAPGAADEPPSEVWVRIPGFRTAAGGVNMVVLGAGVATALVIGIGGGSLLASLAGGIGSPSPSSVPPSVVAVLPSGTPTEAPTPTPSPSPSPSPTPEPTPVLVPAPLTGLMIPEAAALVRPIAIMIDDQKDARPQSGFNAAAQVWQAPAEAGIPRYMMIFQDTLPASVGPIRSARQYFVEWASEWRAMYAHVGGSPEALTTLRAKGHGQWVYNADGFRFDGSLMWRVKFRVRPHNVYTDAPNLVKMAAAVGVKNEAQAPVWRFGPELDADARPIGTSIVIKYPYETITYRYDAITNRYRRFIDKSKTQQIDNADQQPVAPTNVVILRMRFGALNDGHPNKHRLEAGNVGTGEAIISTGGRVINGTWKKASETAPTLLFGPDGQPVTLAAGQTFVQVIALSYQYTVVEGVVAKTDLDLR